MKPGPTPPLHLYFRTTDCDRAGEYLTRVYGTGIQMSVRAGKNSRFSHTRMATPSFAIDVSAQTDEITFTVQPPPVLFVFRLLTATVDFRSAGVERRFGPSELFLGTRAQDDVPYWARSRSGAIQVTALPYPLLSRITSNDEALSPGPIRFTDRCPTDPRAARDLAATVDYLSGSLSDRPESLAEPLVSSAAGRLLAAQVLATFPNTARTEPTAEDRRDAGQPEPLRRAVAFIDDHAHEDISAADIAAAAKVSIRALEYAFRAHRGTTPMGYLRRVRLHHAHRELLGADPATGVTVTQVAARWGFFHPGRFAAYYRTVYGEAPYRTLLRDAP